jgi:YegS/Rv2252/BmrU family lipid kinase
MLFIMNPYAGTRKAAKELTEILGVFNQAEYEITVYMTSGTGDALRIAGERSEGMDLVVCCGGDGTLNETVSGLLGAGWDIPIGYIPAGSTNDFATSLKLSLNPIQAAKDIVEGKPVAYDAGRFGDRYFAYIASFGAFTRVSYNTPQYVKNALGHTAYLLSGISELSQIRDIRVRLEVDDMIIEDDFLFGAISNSTSVGGIVTLSPDRVDMGDGLFEILLVRAPRNFTELTECVQAVQNQDYLSCPNIKFFSASSVKLTMAGDVPWTLDGEKAEGIYRVNVENLHHAIRLMQRVD